MAVGVMLGLTGCGGGLGESTGSESALSDIRYVEVETPNGTVACLVYNGYNKGGLDCDWEAVR